MPSKLRFDNVVFNNSAHTVSFDLYVDEIANPQWSYYAITGMFGTFNSTSWYDLQSNNNGYGGNVKIDIEDGSGNLRIRWDADTGASSDYTGKIASYDGKYDNSTACSSNGMETKPTYCNLQ